MLLKDKVAIITGGGSGVGRESAKLFANEGARVVIGDVRNDWGHETVRLVKDLGGTAIFVRTDVSREAEVRNLVQTALEKYGTLDIMFNNVGVATARPYKPTWEYTDEDWDRLININFRSVFYGCKHAIPVFQEKKRGVIINTGSAAGMVAWGGVPYGVSKAGVIQLSRGLAVELAPFNIRVNCICPGSIDTNFGKEGFSEDARRAPSPVNPNIPLSRNAGPEEIAQTALYLASDMSTYVTGASILVDGGYTAR